MKTILTILMLTVSCGGDGNVMQDDGALGIVRRRPVPVSDAGVGRDDGAVSQVVEPDAMPLPEPDAMLPEPDTAPACTPMVEICDGKDNDCDGVIDNDARILCGHQIGRFGGHVYMMIGIDYTWLEARDACLRLGYVLASIETVEEWTALVPWLVTSAYGGHAWLGLHRESESAPWQWLSGAPVNFTAWRDGQPNNKEGSEFCADLRVDANTETVDWSDRPCDGAVNVKAFPFCEAQP